MRDRLTARGHAIMVNCCLKKCKNDTRTKQKNEGVSYFRFPKNEIRREEWRKLVSKERGEKIFKPKNKCVICSDHFTESDMYYTDKGRRRIKNSAIPCIEPKHDIDNYLEWKLVKARPKLKAKVPDKLLALKLFNKAIQPSTSQEGSCKHCGKEITTGFLYRCMVCVDYEFCGECEGRGTDLHHDNHYVLRVPALRPSEEVEQVELAVRQALASIPSWNNFVQENTKKNVETAESLSRIRSKKKPVKTKPGRSVCKKRKISNEQSETAHQYSEIVNEHSETGNEHNETGNEHSETGNEHSETANKQSETIIELIVPVQREIVNEQHETLQATNSIKREVMEIEIEPEIVEEVVIKKEFDPLLEQEVPVSSSWQNVLEPSSSSGLVKKAVKKEIIDEEQRSFATFSHKTKKPES